MGAKAYYESYPVVEIQQTFYEPPAPATMLKWRAQAPAGFEFTMKAWQVITHTATSRTYRRMRTPMSEAQKKECGAFRTNDTVLQAWQTTLDRARLIRASAILFQCPASFRWEKENVASMKRFFAEIGRSEGIRYLWEPRGPWPDEAVRELCAELGLIHAVDPFVRPSLTPELIYWRLHGNGSSYASYTDSELQKLQEWLEPCDGEAYVMFNNIPRPGDSQRFLEMVNNPNQRMAGSGGKKK